MSNLHIGLRGNFVRLNRLPEHCACGGKRFYKQTDFNRNLGLTVVGIAAVATFVLAFRGYSWLVTWSPMPLALIFDFSLSRSRPVAALCYNCGLIYRGVDAAQLEATEDFNLETYDIIQYPNRQTE